MRCAIVSPGRYDLNILFSLNWAKKINIQFKNLIQNIHSNIIHSIESTIINKIIHYKRWRKLFKIQIQSCDFQTFSEILQKSEIAESVRESFPKKLFPLDKPSSDSTSSGRFSSNIHFWIELGQNVSQFKTKSNIFIPKIIHFSKIQNIQ